MKILIAYFSRKGNNYLGGGIKNLKMGNTEVAAKTIQKLSGGDIFRIDTVETYPTDYDETTRPPRNEAREKAPNCRVMKNPKREAGTPSETASVERSGGTVFAETAKATSVTNSVISGTACLPTRK